jgi:hypothetical protein
MSSATAMTINPRPVRHAARPGEDSRNADILESGASEAPDWVTVLGTAMAPPMSPFLWAHLRSRHRVRRDGVAPVFRVDASRREVAGKDHTGE